MLQWHIANIHGNSIDFYGGEIILSQSELDLFDLEFISVHTGQRKHIMTFAGQTQQRILAIMRSIDWNATGDLCDLQSFVSLKTLN